jgi:hypothetical protein
MPQHLPGDVDMTGDISRYLHPEKWLISAIYSRWDGDMGILDMFFTPENTRGCFFFRLLK